jgi:FixJ family two-component response regulator
MSKESFTIYVIDDDESIRRALQRLLRSAGYHTVAFASAEDFMDYAPESEQGCLVLDILLPGMTGLDLQENLATKGATSYPVIFITAHDNPQWQARAKKKGALAYLQKPFSEQTLLDAVGHCRQQMGSNKTNDRQYR